jgi:serine/threonine-protein kinase
MTPTPDNPPRKIGKYEVRREVGRGGMSIVYEGFDALINRRVALKTFLTGPQEGGSTDGVSSDGSASDGLSARLRREAQAAGCLSHPHIVAVYDYGEETLTDDAGVARTNAYIAMEFIDGRSLESYLDGRERFALPQIVSIMSQLLDALDYSHSRGVVHRDIKPANIMVLPDGNVKVADFGIARIESSTLTQMGTVLGSPAYMSPEQFMGQTVDARSDLYSAGVVLYQLLTGELPFTGSFSAIMHRVLNEQATPPSALNVQLPTSVDPMVRKAMAKRPAERYQSAREFRQALESVAGSTAASAASAGGASASGTSASGASARSASASGASASEDATQLRVTAPGTAGRERGVRRAPLIALAAFLGVAALGAAWFFAHRTHGPVQAAVPPAIATKPPPTEASPFEWPADGKSAVISAVGIIRPGAAGAAQDAEATEHALWLEARRQLIAKAAALYVQPRSLHANYDLLRTRLLTRPDEFITAVLRQGPPATNQDGSMMGTLWATVSVRDVQKALNQISRDERVDFIRNHGDPRIAVSIRASDSEVGAGERAQRSEVAENILKDRIRSFGFEIVDREHARPPADFYVDGEVHFKKLSARLPASGLTIEKFALTSWTVKAIDAKTGEEVYHNTKIPERQSWATEELALTDVGNLIGAEFSPTFFLQYFDFKPRRVRLHFTGLPPAISDHVLDELNGELRVLNATLIPQAATEGTQAGADGAQAGADVEIDAQVSAGDQSLPDFVLQSIVAPLNAKIGRPCFSIASAGNSTFHIAFDSTCAAADLIQHLETAPREALSEISSTST